jgi:hypothetical protein
MTAILRESRPGGRSQGAAEEGSHGVSFGFTVRSLAALLWTRASVTPPGGALIVVQASGPLTDPGACRDGWASPMA